jgi:hypothetical protein
LLCALAVGLGVFVALRVLAANPEPDGPVKLDAVPVPLDPGDPGRLEVGALHYLGGLWLRSDDPRFGGLSDLRLSPDGRELMAVSDCGHGFTARLGYDVNGKLVGISDARMVALTGGEGQPLGHEEIDAESLMAVGTDELDVGFEGSNCIRAYGRDFAGPGRLQPVPVGLDECGSNSGLELMADVGDGRRLLICEGRRDASSSVPAWIGAGDAWQTREYPLTFAGGWGAEPFRPTGAARLSSGDVLVLERRFPPLGARLVLLSKASLDASGALSGREIARIEAPLTLDNFEGLEVLQDGGGRVLVYLISDDNNCAKTLGARRGVSPQRTLLLQFSLGDSLARGAAAPGPPTQEHKTG